MATSTSGANQRVGVDNMINRNRLVRTLFAFLSLIVLIGLPTLIVNKIHWDLLGESGGVWLGLATGAFIASRIAPRYLISVDSAQAFLTINTVAALFKMHPYATYGAGVHFSYPWERRLEENNVALQEVTLELKTAVPGKTSEILVEGSYRIRPNICQLDKFIGVSTSTITDGIGDLIKAKVAEKLRDKEIDEALRALPALNIELGIIFGVDPSTGTHTPAAEVADFEDRFGIVTGDVTIARLYLPPDVQKTRDGVAEAEIIAKGTAIMLGLKDFVAVEAARKEGSITQDDIDAAQARFMAASKNMDVKFHIFQANIKGLTPEAVAAIAALANQYTAARGSGSGRKGGNP